MSEVTKDSLWNAYQEAKQIMETEPGVLGTGIPCGELVVNGAVHHVTVKIEEEEVF